MKAINLYELTRVEDEDFAKFEAHLSQRENLIKAKKHEINSLKSFVNKVEENLAYEIFDGFYYSYAIPQISKEFDLLRIGEDYIINIELKSHIEDIEKVTKQLIKNIFYLKHLGKDICSYTYDSETDILYQLVANELKKIDFINLIDKIKNQHNLFKKDINTLFNPSMFLVSPLNNTEKFLKEEYFLTLNQLQIKEDIEKEINKNNISYFAIKGGAGCGKTLLTYDIALDYAKHDKKVCIIHCAYLCSGQEVLKTSSSLKIFSVKDCGKIDYTKYDIIIIDEAQRIYKQQFEYIIGKVKENNLKLIFSYDEKQMLNSDEVNNNIPSIIESLDSVKMYELTKKIRTNPELLFFIKKIFNLNDENNFNNYTNISLKYAPTEHDAFLILYVYINKGYEFITYTPSQYDSSKFDKYMHCTNQTAHKVIGQEFDNVIMYLDDNFYYKDNKLCAKNHVYNRYLLSQMLFQGITRTRNKLVLVVVDNKDLFENILSILK